MKRVALINPPAPRPLLRDYFCTSVPKTGYYWHPIDLLCLSGRLAAAADLVVVDAVAEGLDGGQVMARLGNARLSAAVVLAAAGFDADLEFAAQLKAGKAEVVVGLGEDMLGDPAGALGRHPFLDAVLTDFVGDALVRWLDGERAPVPGIVFLVGGGIRDAKEPARGMFVAPPAEHTRFPLDAYRLPFAVPHPWVSILSSFGCPFRCAYCNSGSFGYRLRDPANLAEELDVVSALGIRHVFVRDMTFAADRAHGEEICRVFEGRGLSWNCYCRIDRVDMDLLRRMAAAGCVMIHFGVESAASDLRTVFLRGAGVERAEEAFAWSREAGIAAGAHFILGLPGETEEDVEKTIGFARRLKPDYASFNIFTPRAGSKLARDLEKEGRVVDPAGAPRDCSFGQYRVAGGIPPGRFEKLRRRAVVSFYADPRYILRQARKVRSLSQLAHLACSGLQVLRGEG
ncbi:MAG: radical SAM protein [Deltaproteobacteria bacterium]|nr:radical SAM protein [Deltaproteobacteria bacterium]